MWRLIRCQETLLSRLCFFWGRAFQLGINHASNFLLWLCAWEFNGRIGTILRATCSNWIAQCVAGGRWTGLQTQFWAWLINNGWPCVFFSGALWGGAPIAPPLDVSIDTGHDCFLGQLRWWSLEHHWQSLHSFSLLCDHQPVKMAEASENLRDVDVWAAEAKQAATCDKAKNNSICLRVSAAQTLCLLFSGWPQVSFPHSAVVCRQTHPLSVLPVRLYLRDFWEEKVILICTLRVLGRCA